MTDATPLFSDDPGEADVLRRLEAILFAAMEPLSMAAIAAHFPGEIDLPSRLKALKTAYANRGVQLVEVAGGWAFRTAPDLADALRPERVQTRKLSQAATETLAIVAYHQPVTRAEIEEIRGVAVAKGTLDILLETGWVRLRGRRRVPGRPVTFGTTPQFLAAFSLPSLADLPGLDDLRGAGLLEGSPPASFRIPMPEDDAALSDDEEPLGEDAPAY